MHDHTSRLTPEISVAELARRLGARLEGDRSPTIRRVATLVEAGPDAIAWMTHPRYARQLAETRAAAIIIHNDAPGVTGKTVLRVADVEAALCDVLTWLAPPTVPIPIGVDALACVDRSATVTGASIGPHVCVGLHAVIGAGTQLHAGVYVGAHSVIGRDSVLWPNVVIRERVTIGERVIIHPNATIGSDGFGYIFRDGRHRKVPQNGTVVIEDDVEIGANTAVDRAKCGTTRIGRGTKIDNLVQLGHNAEIGEHCIIVAQCGISGSTTLGRGVVLGGQVGLIDHVTLGDGVMIAAGSAVFGDLPTGQVARGRPAVPSPQYLRQEAALRRLPKLMKQVRELTRRIEQLERDSTANDTARG